MSAATPKISPGNGGRSVTKNNPTLQPLIRCAALAVVLSSLPACTFHRVSVNKNYNDVDVSWLRAGETTWQEVLKRWGAPVSAGNPADAVRAQVSTRFLKYASWEVKTSRFGTKWWFPFYWRDGRALRELLLEFDEDGKLKECWETQNDTVWRPLFGPPADPETQLVTSLEAP